MATDDERRRVAAALREYASFDCEDEGEEECLVDCADWGERVLNLLGCGDTEGECYAALADLIEPSEPKIKCVAEVKVDGERLEELAHDTVVEVTSIDRDALLELADGLDKDADNIISAARDARFTGGRPRMGEAEHDAYEWRCIALRIREALGVES